MDTFELDYLFSNNNMWTCLKCDHLCNDLVLYNNLLVCPACERDIKIEEILLDDDKG